MNLVFFIDFFLFSVVLSKNITVKTFKGEIIGSVEKSGQSVYYTYFGIPYAVVDKGNPFGASKDVPKFEKFDAKEPPSIVCAQMKRGTSEVIGRINCLKLNIFVPSTSTPASPAPVLLWFRGEEIDTDYDAQYLVKLGIIVVVANYRLGPYGFLCLDDPAVTGNQGLKDQHAALVWVSQNIPVFGGDRNRITIAGQGASVELHLYGKMPQLFDKAIIHSGTSLSVEMYIQGDKQTAIKIAKHLGHYPKNTSEAINVLSKIQANEVIKASADLNLNLKPCIEKEFKSSNNFVTQGAMQLGNDVNNKFTKSKIMIGYTSNEKLNEFVNKTDEDFEKMQDIFNVHLALTYNLSSKDLKNLEVVVKSFYLGSKKIDKLSVINISNFVSDISINYAMEIAISRYVSQFAPMAIYKWLFSFTDNKKETKGASNSDEIKYLFGNRNQNYTFEQISIRDRMTEMWANFVKHGNPTPNDIDGLIWPSITDDFYNKPFMNIDTTMKIQQNIYHERIAFWDLFFMNYFKYYKSVVHK